jgi:Na+-driven multidrug efflux pump
MRCGLAALFTWLELSVAWVYGALVGDYLLKGAMLIWRFRTGRWKTLLREGRRSRRASAQRGG